MEDQNQKQAEVTRIAIIAIVVVCLLGAAIFLIRWLTSGGEAAVESGEMARAMVDSVRYSLLLALPGAAW